MKLTIGKRILFGYGLAMLFMALTGIAAYRGTVQLLDANDWVRHTYLVIDVAKDIRADMLRVRKRLPGIFERPAMSIYMDSDEGLTDAHGREPETASNAHGRQSLTTAQARRHGSADRPQAGRFDAGIANLRREKGFAVAAAGDAATACPRRTAEVKDLLAAVENEERILLAEREQIAQRDAQSTNRIILFGDLVGFALAAFIGIATRRSITRRLAEFQQLVTFVGEGDLTPKSAREGGDEMGKLAQGLNQIVSRLRNMATQTRAATENLNAATDGNSGFRQGTVRRHRRAGGGLPGDQCHHAAGQPVRPSDQRKGQAGHHLRGGRLSRQYLGRGCRPEGQPNRGSDSRASRGSGPEHCRR